MTGLRRGWRRRSTVATIAAVVVGTATLAPSAPAHGDLATGVLYRSNLFVPRGMSAQDPPIERLRVAVEAANEAGYALKVAMIREGQDLGEIPGFYGKPQRYARFVADDLRGGFAGRVVVVMPRGLGLSRFGRVDAGEIGLVRRLEPKRSGEGLPGIAETAVRLLSARAGHPLAEPRSVGGKTRDRLVLGGAGALAVLLAAAAAVARRRAGVRKDPLPR